ncbi:PmoA family protein [Pinibacter soli]|uniref:PmoA family protein n=1 Tax=Pinibacter soli TaxID=3044211 RepID=A0ABT6RDG8_9BACT|nr:PmoA family protein [Pinibacter soli]MDI3320618.1 PmoA family protein [Pinibacter soli]
MRIIYLSYCLVLALSMLNNATAQKISLRKDTLAKELKVFAGDKLFTSFCYSDTLTKPILYPVCNADGTTITRGFPFQPRAGEPTDHPHHQGIWFNYENVNGIDFWNNSYAIPEAKKHLYGSVKTESFTSQMQNKSAVINYTASWNDINQQALIKEKTILIFSARNNIRIIDRTTILQAEKDVAFNDTKDGLIAMRVAHELQIPVKGDTIANGNYITSEGKTGDSVWSTRAAWCMLYGKIGGHVTSIVMFDQKNNPGYPTYWHARGYGLFAANPLGQKVFSNGKTALNLRLAKGESATFRYRIAIAADEKPLSREQIEHLSDF